MINKSMQRWDGMQVSCTRHVQGNKRLQINIYLRTRKLQENLQHLVNIRGWKLSLIRKEQILHYALESYNYIFRWKIITFCVKNIITYLGPFLVHLDLVLQFAAIITFSGVKVVPRCKVRVVTMHGVTASVSVTRADLTFAPSRKIRS